MRHLVYNTGTLMRAGGGVYEYVIVNINKEK